VLLQESPRSLFFKPSRCRKCRSLRFFFLLVLLLLLLLLLLLTAGGGVGGGGLLSRGLSPCAEALVDPPQKII